MCNMSFSKVFECDKCNAQFKVSVEMEITKKGVFEYFDPETKELLFTDKRVEMPCRWCDGIATDKVKRVGKYWGWKSQTTTTKRRQREFQEKGMDKAWAEDFYKDATAASKERIYKSTRKDFYKHVDPDMKVLCEQGKARPTQNKSKRVDYLKDINRELSKGAKKYYRDKK